MTRTSAPPSAMDNNTSRMHFTKTETEYNMKSIRFLLLTITAMFIVISMLMVVLGISVYTYYHGFSSFYDGNNSGFMTPSAMCVFIGVALLLVSIFGFFGSLKLSTCMVNVYACILMTVFILKLVAVILAFTVDSARIMDFVNIPIYGYNDPEIQQEVDALQANFGCCGSNSFTDYLGFHFTNYQATVQVNMMVNNEMTSMPVPKSCCFSYSGGVCERVAGMGCKEALTIALVQNSTVIGVLGVSVMFINLLGIIFALLLARCIRKLKSARALIQWKLREKMIRQREAEEMQNDEAQVYIDHQASSQA